MFDFIIVGQGLAGTILANTFLKNGLKPLVINKDKSNASSRVAAGLFNPITGKRMTLSWMAPDLFPFLNQYYSSFEKTLNKKFYFPLPVCKPFSSDEEQRQWLNFSKWESYSDFIAVGDDFVLPDSTLNSNLGGYMTKYSGFIDLPLMLDTFCEYLKERDMYIEGEMVYENIKLSNDGVEYNGHKAKGIIFCEGCGASNNPYFSWLPFGFTKGQILKIYSEGLCLDKIVSRKGLFILPLGNHEYKVGATYERHYEHEQPDEAGKDELVDKLEAFIKVPYKIIGHEAAVRPTVKDRKPLLGTHPEHKNVYVFNGMGTKGVSLSPFFSERFLQYLTDNKELDPSVNIERFFALYKPLEALR